MAGEAPPATEKENAEETPVKAKGVRAKAKAKPGPRPESWEDTKQQGEDLDDPKVRVRCKDRYRKFLAKEAFGKKKGTRCNCS